MMYARSNTFPRNTQGVLHSSKIKDIWAKILSSDIIGKSLDKAVKCGPHNKLDKY